MSVFDRKLFGTGPSEAMDKAIDLSGRPTSTNANITRNEILANAQDTLTQGINDYILNQFINSSIIPDANQSTDVSKDVAGKFKSYYEMLQETGLGQEKQPFDKFAAYAPGAAAFFGALTKPVPAGVAAGPISAGAIQLGQAAESSAPLLAQAAQAEAAYEAIDPDANLKQIALELALKDDPSAVITGQNITETLRDGKPVKLLTYFKDGQYVERVIGDVPTKDDPVKGIPRDIFDNLSDEFQEVILGVVKNPDITNANVINTMSNGTPTQVLTYFENGQFKRQILGEIVPEDKTVKGVPIDIFNDLPQIKKDKLLGVEADAPEAVKGIPRALFDKLNDTQKDIILGLGGPGITDVKISDVVLDGEAQKVMTYFDDGKLVQVPLGQAPENEDNTTEAERAINRMDDLLNMKKSDFPDLDTQYGPFPSGDSLTLTQDDIDLIKRKMSLDLAKVKTTESKDVLSVDEQAAIGLNNAIVDKITLPTMQKITEAQNVAVKNKEIANGVRIAANEFKGGALVDSRLVISKFVDLIGYGNLSESVKNALTTLRIGNPVGGDILQILTSQLTLSNAEGGALPGNLNQQEFQELKNAGLPLFTTKDGMLIMSDIIEREADVNIAANRMLNDLIAQQQEGETSITLTFPDGTTEVYDNAQRALNAIEDFKVVELPKVYSGSKMMKTDDLTPRIQGLGRYDKDSFDLSDGQVTFTNRANQKNTFSAKQMDEEGRLLFSHFGDLDNPNKKHRNKAVYLFNTGEFWLATDEGYDERIHVVGEPKFIYWVKAD